MFFFFFFFKQKTAYEIHLHCACCDGEHPLLLRVHFDRGPEHKQSIAKSLPEGSVPPQLLALRSEERCVGEGRESVECRSRIYNHVCALYVIISMRARSI